VLSRTRLLRLGTDVGLGGTWRRARPFVTADSLDDLLIPRGGGEPDAAQPVPGNVADAHHASML
jgi:hypothetical protein